jgi:hypothetical protein
MITLPVVPIFNGKRRRVEMLRPGTGGFRRTRSWPEAFTALEYSKAGFGSRKSDERMLVTKTVWIRDIQNSQNMPRSYTQWCYLVITDLDNKQPLMSFVYHRSARHSVVFLGIGDMRQLAQQLHAFIA